MSKNGEEQAGLLSSDNKNGSGGYSSLDRGSDAVSDVGSGDSSILEDHGTTPGEAFFNLLKGYFGAGMLRYANTVIPLLDVSVFSHPLVNEGKLNSCHRYQ